MLHSHSDNFQAVHKELHLPFQKNISVQNKVKIKGLRIERSRLSFLPKVAIRTNNSTYLPLGCPRTSVCVSTLNTILFYIRYILAFRTTVVNIRDLVHAHSSYQSVSYPAQSRSHKIRTAHSLEAATFTSGHIKQRWPTSVLITCHRPVCLIHAYV